MHWGIEKIQASLLFYTQVANSFISWSLVSFGHCSFMHALRGEYIAAATSNLSNNQHAWCHVFDIGSKSTTVLQVGCTHNSIRAVKVREPLATKVKVTLSKKAQARIDGLVGLLYYTRFWKKAIFKNCNLKATFFYWSPIFRFWNWIIHK